MVDPPEDGYPAEDSQIIRRIDSLAIGQALMPEGLSVYDLKPRSDMFGVEGSFRQSGNLATYWIHVIGEGHYLFWLVGRVEDDPHAAWFQQLTDYAWWACGSGSGSFGLYMPEHIYQTLVEASQPARRDSFMVGPLEDIMRAMLVQ